VAPLNEMPDSPDLSSPWCPGCRPDVDLTKEILRTVWCPVHYRLSAGGTADSQVLDRGLAARPMLGTGEADDINGRRIAELLRGETKACGCPAKITGHLRRCPEFRPAENEKSQ